MKTNLWIIDDNEMMCEFLYIYFKEAYQVSIYRDAELALKEANNSGSPEVIQLDLNLPNFSGLEFLKAYQPTNEQENTSIIVLSGNDKSADRIECLALGASDYLSKPFHPKELALRIQNLA